MSGPRRWRAAAGTGVALSLVLVLLAVWRAGERYAGAYALRIAQTVGSYLALATPRARDGGPGYDLAPLLVQARGLATLPGLGADIEVYHRTAPLVRATAPSLSPAAFDGLRRREVAEWRDGRALVPLKDRDDWAVMGAVAARPRSVWPPPGALPFLASVLIVLASGWLAVRTLGRAERGALAAYAAAAVVLGAAAYGAVRGAARASTDRWLEDTRLLVQDIAARAPGGRVPVVSLARLAPGARLVTRGGRAGPARRERFRGAPTAVADVRVGGRWLELRTAPAESSTHGWLALLLTLGLLGPGVAAVCHWGARTAVRPREFKEAATAWSFLAPAAVHLAVFAFAPMVFAVYLAVHGGSLLDPVKPFVGLGNVAEVLRDPLVWVALKNTLLFTLSVPGTMALALAAALALQRGRTGVPWLGTTLLIPAISSAVAIAFVWQWLYDADFGVINWALSLAGRPPVDWLGNPRTALVAVILVSAWMQLGYQTVVFLAALQSIPAVYYDAARVDGAGTWHRFWYLTLPLLKPVTLFVLVTGVIASFQVFTYIYVMTEGGPLHATDVLAFRIYRAAWEFLRFGYASALALMLFVILFGVTWAQVRLLRGRVEYA